MTFQSYGLIRSPFRQALYQKAHIANVYTGIADPREHETVALMQLVLYKNIFTSDDFGVNAEQPPANISNKRCDIVVRYLENGSNTIKVLCFAECKRSSTSQNFSLRALEKQALGYCMSCLKNNEDMPFVYAATMAGAHVRLWKCNRDGFLPFWGRNQEGDWSEYKDIGDDEAAGVIEYCFNQMKGSPPTPHAGQSNNNYIESVTTTRDNQAATSSYQTMYQAGAPTPGYQAIAPVYQTPASDFQGGQNQMGTGTGADEEDYEETVMEEEVECQQGTMSNSGSQRHVVKDFKTPHLMSKDEFKFKDRKGKWKTTTADSWQ